jgi:hypothetical protein
MSIIMVQQTSPTWFSVGIVGLLALGLMFTALVVVITVIIASGGASAFKRQLKTAGLILLLVLPALGVVGLVGAWFTSVRVVSHQSEELGERQIQDGRRRPRQSARYANRQSVTTRREHFDDRSPSSESTAEAPLPSSITPIAGSSTISGVSSAEAHVVSQTTSAQSNTAENPTASASPAQSEASSATTPTEAAPSPLAAETQPAPPTVNQPVPVIVSDADSSRPAGSVLRVRETLPHEPEWAKVGPLPSDPGVLVPLSSQRFATLAEAEEQVTQLAVDYVKKFYRDENPLPGDWTVPVSLIDKYAVNALCGEELEKDFGNGIQGKMYRAHLRLDLSSKLRQALHESWRGQIVSQRLTMLGAGLGMVTVMLAASAGYFRLNEMTQGQYGGRLKLAALALIGAAGLGMLTLA